MPSPPRPVRCGYQAIRIPVSKKVWFVTCRFSVMKPVASLLEGAWWRARLVDAVPRFRPGTCSLPFPTNTGTLPTREEYHANNIPKKQKITAAFCHGETIRPLNETHGCILRHTLLSQNQSSRAYYRNRPMFRPLTCLGACRTLVTPYCDQV